MSYLEALADQELISLRDAVNRELLRRRHTTGLRLDELLNLLEAVKTTLRDQGKEWRSLERWQYIDGQICFWLNPVDQSRYTMGWFSIDELIQWSHDIGPIMVAAETAEELLVPTPAWSDERAFDLAA